jgi:hypothetical protein
MSEGWIGVLEGADAQMRGYARQSASGYDMQVWIEEVHDTEGEVLWSSPHLDGLTSQTDVQDRAAALKALWDGGIYLYRGGGHVPRGPGLLHHDTLGNADVSMGDWTVDPFDRTLVAKAPGTRKKFRDPTKLWPDYAWALAAHDPLVLERLKGLGRYGLTYGELFKLYEDLRAAGWSDQFIDSTGGATAASSVSSRLRATANNPTVSGAASRHGGVGTPPSRLPPVSEADAAPVLLKAYRHLLAIRGAAINLDALL